MLKRGTKIGWILVALSLVLTVWVLVGNHSKADTVEDGDFTFADSTKAVITAYKPDGAVNVTIPDTVTTIGQNAFAGNTRIAKVVFPNTVTAIESGAFQGAINLSEVSFGTGLKNIGQNAFAGDSSITAITLPDTLTTIGAKAFENTGLSTVTIPASVTNIGEGAFANIQDLTDIQMANGSTSFVSSDGALYNANGSKLIFVPRGKTSLTVRSGATTIGANSMQGNTNLTSIIIPASVTSIEENAFTKSGIKSITIPKTVTNIANQADWAVEEIQGYAGSKAQEFATANGYLFRTLDNPAPAPNNGGGTTPGNNNNNGGTTPNNNNGGTTPNTNTNTNTGTNTNTQTNTNTNKTPNVKPATNTKSGQHVKDDVPGTAGPIDARYFLCISVFLAGIAFLVYSRRTKFEYMANNKKR